MKNVTKSVVGGIAIGILLASQSGAEGLPDVLGVQLGMPAREAHAKLQTQIPKNKVQILSTNLPAIEKPVITSFSSPPQKPLRWEWKLIRWE